jgi:hypothetical protein
MVQNGCEIRGHFKFDFYSVIKVENTMTNIYYGLDFFFRTFGGAYPNSVLHTKFFM